MTLAFYIRFLVRQWHSKLLKVLSLALMIGIAGTTTVMFFTDRIDNAVRAQARTFLAADVLVSSRNPIDPAWRAQATQQGLQSALTTQLFSVASTENALQLATVKAVTPAYPLRGELHIGTQSFGPGEPTDRVPAPGSVWLESRLLGLLEVDIGDSISLGESTFTIDAVLTYEPDRGIDTLNIGPRLLMNEADLAATLLIQPGSRATYNLLVAGDSDPLEAWSEWLEPQLAFDDNLQQLDDSRSRLNRTIASSERYLNLAALVSLILAGIAIAICAARFAQEQFDNCALLRCLGATSAHMLKLYVSIVMIVGLLGSVLGVAIGYGAQYGLATILAAAFQEPLPAPSLQPIGIGFMAGLVIIGGFALPPLLRLRHVPPLRVLQHGTLPVPELTKLIYTGASIATFGLMWWLSDDLILSTWLSFGLIITIAVLYVGAYTLIYIAKLCRHRLSASLRFAIANLYRHANSHIVQILTTGLAIAVILSVAIVRTDILDNWFESIRTTTVIQTEDGQTITLPLPNQLAFNIAPDTLHEMTAFLQENEIDLHSFYPMIRGRITHINDVLVNADDYPADGPGVLRRELNLTWQQYPPENNPIVAGNWFSAQNNAPEISIEQDMANYLNLTLGDTYGLSAQNNAPEISIEQGMANYLNLTLGDTLSFDINAQTVSATVSSIRTVNWESFQPNFYVIFSPGVIDEISATYLTSFYIPPQQYDLLNVFTTQFPAVTLIDIESAIAQVRSLINKASLGVQYIFIFCLLATFMVLIASQLVSMQTRLQETALMRTLGAKRNQIIRYYVSEALLSGGFAGFLGALMATLGGYYLATLFSLEYQLNPWIWLLGLAWGALFQGIVGGYRLKVLLKYPPVKLLQTAAA